MSTHRHAYQHNFEVTTTNLYNSCKTTMLYWIGNDEEMYFCFENKNVIFTWIWFVLMHVPLVYKIVLTASLQIPRLKLWNCMTRLIIWLINDRQDHESRNYEQNFYSTSLKMIYHVVNILKGLKAMEKTFFKTASKKQSMTGLPIFFWHWYICSSLSLLCEYDVVISADTMAETR